MERKMKNVAQIVALAHTLKLTSKELLMDADFMGAFGQHRYPEFLGYREEYIREAATML